MITSLAIKIKNTIHDLATQVYIFTGLQNAAPPGATGKSIQYLLETAAELEQTSLKICYRQINRDKIITWLFKDNENVYRNE